MSHTELPADLTLPYKACLSAFTPYLTHAHLRALVEPFHSVVDPRNRPIDQYSIGVTSKDNNSKTDYLDSKELLRDCVWWMKCKQNM